MTITELDHVKLDKAVRLAIRGHGLVEPNPMVGCVISAPDGKIIAAAGHQRFGEAHAEALALKQAGSQARGSSVHVTLEPCTHQGKTPPCADALIQAGVSRVVIGALDPNPEAAGGVARLEAAGIQVTVADHLPSRELIQPFATWKLKNRPWVILKWAQTLDGRIATRTGDSKWISSDVSRRLVHRERGRVDAVLSGMGTVHADNPQLTARNVRKRRTATRVILDRDLEVSPDHLLVRTINEAPLLLVCDEQVIDSPRAELLRRHGAILIGRSMVDSHFDLPSLLEHLLKEFNLHTILVEAGAGLMSSLITSRCVDELAVFVAPRIMADPKGLSPLSEDAVNTIQQTRSAQLTRMHRRADDVLLRYRIQQSV
ncbi:MAG: riboflavin biosynthesis protein RibD [Phycisphaerae bacterium]|nr:riboflavin biosynthesis protein RibD [Phycisphaerae bacterium]